jgi:peroxiredoxin
MKDIKYILAMLAMMLFAFTVTAYASNENKDESKITEVKNTKLPDFQLIDLEGERVNLQDFAGKKTFLNVWATWCPPCVREMPSIQKLYDSVKNEDIVILLLSVDQNFAKVEPFMKRRNLRMPAYGPAERLPAMFNTGSIPSTFVFDSDGKLAWKHIGMADYSTERFRNFLVNEVK